MYYVIKNKPSILQCVPKGCARYIFSSLFLSLKESTCKTRKKIYYFTSKALFVLEIFKIYFF